MGINQLTSDDVSDSTLANLRKSQSCGTELGRMIPDGEVAVCLPMVPLEHAKTIYPKLAELAELLHISPHSPHRSSNPPHEGLEFSYLLGVLGQVFLVCPSLPATAIYRASMSSRRLFISSIISD